MKRQPFLPTYKGTPVNIGPGIIEKVPDLARIIGRIAVHWTGVELHLSLLLGSLLGIENPSSVAVFLSLRNHRAQRDALSAAAEKSLIGETKFLFDKIMSLHQIYDKQRNEIVHGIWGIGEATPDKIVWCSSQDHANMLITDYHLGATGKLSAQERPNQIVKDCYWVKYSDLESLCSDIQELASLIMLLHASIRYAGEKPGANALRKLKVSPLIQTTT